MAKSERRLLTAPPWRIEDPRYGVCIKLSSIRQP
jgi:hypothetical protein